MDEKFIFLGEWFFLYYYNSVEFYMITKNTSRIDELEYILFHAHDECDEVTN